MESIGASLRKFLGPRCRLQHSMVIGIIPHLGSDERLPLPMARKLAVQLAKGLEYIHSYGVIHGGMCLRPGRGVT
jgi:serine/threonine protein kinase